MSAAGKEAMLEASEPKRMSRCCKCCIGCSVATAVLLAVAIPVGIWVVGPNLAQQAVDMAELHISHSNIYDVPDSGANGTMFSEMTIHSPMLLGATLESTTVTLVANQPDPSPYGFTNGPIGNFTMPSMTVHKGDNTQQFTSEVLFNHSADMGFRFVFWTYMVTNFQVARINVTAEPAVRSFGLRFKTKMTKQLLCNCMKGTGCVPEKAPLEEAASEGASRRLSGTIAPVYLFCEPLGTDVQNGTAWNLKSLADAASQLSSVARGFLA